MLVTSVEFDVKLVVSYAEATGSGFAWSELYWKSTVFQESADW